MFPREQPYEQTPTSSLLEAVWYLLDQRDEYQLREDMYCLDTLCIEQLLQYENKFWHKNCPRLTKVLIEELDKRINHA